MATAHLAGFIPSQRWEASYVKSPDYRAFFIDYRALRRGWTYLIPSSRDRRTVRLRRGRTVRYVDQAKARRSAGGAGGRRTPRGRAGDPAAADSGVSVSRSGARAPDPRIADGRVADEHRAGLPGEDARRGP